MQNFRRSSLRDTIIRISLRLSLTSTIPSRTQGRLLVRIMVAFGITLYVQSCAMTYEA